MEAQAAAIGNFFEPARAQFEALVTDLGSSRMAALTHSEVETLLDERGTELMRLLYQGYLDAQGSGEVGTAVRGIDGSVRTHQRVAGRNLTTVFGQVRLARLGLRCPRGDRLCIRWTARLNLPFELYSFGVRRHVAEQAAQVSFEATVADCAADDGSARPKATSGGPRCPRGAGLRALLRAQGVRGTDGGA